VAEPSLEAGRGANFFRLGSSFRAYNNHAFSSCHSGDPGIMTKKTILASLMSASLVSGIALAANANPLLNMGKTTTASAPTSPEISSAEGKVDLLKRKLDQAKQQLDAAKAHLRAAEAEYKAAIADKEALILRTKARELASAAAVEPVDKVEAAPAQASPGNTLMSDEGGAPIPASSAPQPVTLQDLH
jgi:hypothetical protein